MGWALHDDLKPFAFAYMRLRLRHKPAAERQAILARIGFALRSAEVAKRVHPSLVKSEGDD